MTITVLHTLSELLAFGPEWDSLATEATEPNVFYERWMLLPGVRHFPSPHPLFVFVTSNTSQKLIGFFPLERRYGYRRIPIHYLTTWKHPHSVLSTPLVRKGHEEEAWQLFLEWIDNSPESGTLIEFDQISGDGPVYAHLTRLLKAGHRSSDQISYQRALLHSSLRPEEYLVQALSGKRRKEYRRLENRLAERGNLRISQLTVNDNVEQWIADFLSLERRGWKGAAGTALAVHENEETYFRQIASAAFEREQLMMLRMSINDLPIAMKCSFSSGKGSFSLKIAYDEAWSKYSPGLLLELFNIGAVLQDQNIEWMDSCAIPDHFMINRLWMERRQMREVAFSTDNTGSRMFMSTIARLKQFYRSCKRSKHHDLSHLHH